MVGKTEDTSGVTLLIFSNSWTFSIISRMLSSSFGHIFCSAITGPTIVCRSLWSKVISLVGFTAQQMQEQMSTACSEWK